MTDRPISIAIEDPRTPDVTALLQRHLDFCHSVTAPEFVFALDVEKLRLPGITLFGARRGAELVGVCAVKKLSESHAELKSMHVLSSVRGEGIGSSLLDHVVAFAASGGMARISLETGSQDAFSSARSLYARHGFTETDAFGDYQDVPSSYFMTREI